MSYFNIVCDVCGRGVQGITWVNGMKFCAKCYQETFGASKDWQLLDKDKTITEQQQRIAELEEQLKNDTKQMRKKVVQEIKKYEIAIFYKNEVDTILEFTTIPALFKQLEYIILHSRYKDCDKIEISTLEQDKTGENINIYTWAEINMKEFRRY